MPPSFYYSGVRLRSRSLERSSRGGWVRPEQGGAARDTGGSLAYAADIRVSHGKRWDGFGWEMRSKGVVPEWKKGKHRYRRSLLPPI